MTVAAHVGRAGVLEHTSKRNGLLLGSTRVVRRCGALRTLVISVLELVLGHAEVCRTPCVASVSWSNPSTRWPFWTRRGFEGTGPSSRAAVHGDPLTVLELVPELVQGAGLLSLSSSTRAALQEEEGVDSTDLGAQLVTPGGSAKRRIELGPGARRTRRGASSSRRA